MVVSSVSHGCSWLHRGLDCAGDMAPTSNASSHARSDDEETGAPFNQGKMITNQVLGVFDASGLGFLPTNRDEVAEATPPQGVGEPL